ncbi:C6 transcription factor [Penicillium malachiteum]|uniref:C6 transcription factor n=1 Tax=Penicillium malachiteum TaxID=1324776 RepID=A0AAD6HIL5_9EURO|nr:C6 transcription factor [Penicillium malachiteum]
MARPTVKAKKIPCESCAIRKRRCDGRIPCADCTKRGMGQQCRPRPQGSRGTPSSGRTLTLSNANQNQSSGQASTDSSLSSLVSDTPALEILSEQTPLPRLIPPEEEEDVKPDTATILEVSVFSRQQAVHTAHVEDNRVHEPELSVGSTAEMLFTQEQVDRMMVFHEVCLAWIHNVVHVPSFRIQCQSRLSGDSEMPADATWDALYYAMLAFTIHHTPLGKLEAMGLNLFDFMSTHTISSLQAIALLTYIGRNLGQSKRISVMVAAATRIAQCLGLHNIGPDEAPNGAQCADPTLAMKKIHDREMSKRVWWFFVRQDWLQIPSNNMYNIHPTQFDTPMPTKYDENIDCMIVDQDGHHYTQETYTSILNKGDTP